MNEKSVYQSNLMSALHVAINEQRKNEKQAGYERDSALVAGWEDLFNHVHSGGQIIILVSKS